MKQNLILWIAAFIITFLSGFLESITSGYYPVSGTIGVAGEKVSYKFDKVHYGKEPYKLLIRTDIEGLKGRIEFKIKENNNWKIIPLKAGDHILNGVMPAQRAGSELEYRVILFHGSKKYFLPSQKPVLMKFFGKVSPFINALYYLTLFAGLLLSIRSGLDFFNEHEKIKKLSLFTVIVFFVNAFIASPLRKTYLLGAIGNKVPGLQEVFPLENIILFLIWAITVIVIFNIKEYRKAVIISAVIILISFQILFY
jgi:hypothetical protein